MSKEEQFSRLLPAASPCTAGHAFLARMISSGMRRAASSRGLPGYFLFNWFAGRSLLVIGPCVRAEDRRNARPTSVESGDNCPDRLQRVRLALACRTASNSFFVRGVNRS
jgi:hypothetical protein